MAYELAIFANLVGHLTRDKLGYIVVLEIGTIYTLASIVSDKMCSDGNFQFLEKQLFVSTRKS